MASLETVVPGRPGRALRQLLFRVLDGVYADNADRLDPEEGDKNHALAGLLRDNIPFRLASAIHGFDRRHGVSVNLLEGRSTRLLVAGHTICFYKAPPGATGLTDVSFDDSEYKQYLVHRNAAHGQRAMDFRGGDQGGVDVTEDEVDVLVVVHFGNSRTGLERSVIGVPYEVDGMILWDWFEDLYDDGQDYTATADAPTPENREADGGSFGLRLRRDDRSEEQ